MFFKKCKNHSIPYKAVFSVSIETNQAYQERVYGNEKSTVAWANHAYLVSSGEYHFKKEQYTTYDDIKEFVIDILNHELQKECEQFGIPILGIEVKSIYEGSIELFFIVLFGTLAGITGIKDLHSSIKFLRKLAKKKLEKCLKEKHGDNFRIDVDCQIPSGDDMECRYDFNFLHERNIPPICPTLHDESPKRDGFFYYLLVSNVVLLAIVIALVSSAVIKVYF